MNVKLLGEAVQESYKTGTGVWNIYVEESTGKQLEVREMTMLMLRWMCGVTKLDRIRNEKIRELPKVG